MERRIYRIKDIRRNWDDYNYKMSKKFNCNIRVEFVRDLIDSYEKFRFNPTHDFHFEADFTHQYIFLANHGIFSLELIASEKNQITWEIYEPLDNDVLGNCDEMNLILASTSTDKLRKLKEELGIDEALRKYQSSVSEVRKIQKEKERLEDTINSL